VLQIRIQLDPLLFDRFRILVTGTGSEFFSGHKKLPYNLFEEINALKIVEIHVIEPFESGLSFLEHTVLQKPKLLGKKLANIY
jgi:hypothetical protein